MVLQKVRTNLWFVDEAEQAARFYCSVFGGDSQVTQVTRYSAAGPGPEGAVLTVVFTLAGQEHVAINGGIDFPFTTAMSLEIRCADQAEVDRFWDALTAGGEGGHCGWLTDRYGLSWQVVPQALVDLLEHPDPAVVTRVTEALYTMSRIDVAALERAAAA